MIRQLALRFVVARVAATFLICVAMYWCYLFTQTDFRPQWRVVYLSIAAMFLLVGAGVWLKHRWALLASLLLSLLALAVTCFALVGASANFALWLQALVLVAYIAIVGPLGCPRRAG